MTTDAMSQPPDRALVAETETWLRENGHDERQQQAWSPQMEANRVAFQLCRWYLSQPEATAQTAPASHDGLLPCPFCGKRELQRACEVEQAARALHEAVEKLLFDYRTGVYSLEPLVLPNIHMRALLARSESHEETDQPPECGAIRRSERCVRERGHSGLHHYAQAAGRDEEAP